MKRNKFYYSIVLLLIVGVGSTFVVGQSNDFQKIDTTPRRLRSSLPPVTTTSSGNQNAALPSYQPQNPPQVSGGPVVIAAATSQGQASQQTRLVSHDAEEGAELMTRPAVNNVPRVPEQNVPVSATIRQSSDVTGAVTNSATEQQSRGTMSVVGNGNWSHQDDVPEHVFQGISQLQEPAQPPMMPALGPIPGNGGTPPAPVMPNMPSLFGTSQSEPQGNLSTRMDMNLAPPGNNPGVPNVGEQGGLVPFQPLQPGQVPQFEPRVNVSDLGNIGNQPVDEPHDQIRMSFGNPLPPINAQTDDPDNTPLMLPDQFPGQLAVPEEQIARNASVPIDVRNDGASLQLGPSLIGQQGVSDYQEGTGLPGSGELAGAQVPKLVIEKIMPPEVQMNEPMTVTIAIHNTGSSKAKNVVLTDRLPKGARFVEAGSSGTRTQNGEITWQLGDLGINEERVVEMTLVPTTEGEIGSVATATFSVEASGSTRVTKPALTMEVNIVSEEHLVGGELVFEIVISNPGTGIARNITLEEFVPEGLSHPTGKKLSATLGDLKPGEETKRRLTLKCERPGETINYLVVKGENDLFVESKMPVIVLAPGLSLDIAGPKNRLLERKSTYELMVSNPGSAAARDIVLIAKLPAGIDFVSTDSKGAYDPESNTVHWSLSELPAQQSGKIELVTLPRAMGDYKIEFFGRARGNLQDDASYEVSVDGIASLGFEIINKVSPVELGREAMYEIRVFNRGTKASSNVSVRVQFPNDMRFVAAEGPTQHNVTGSIVEFDKMFQLAPGDDKAYLVRAQCLATGDQRIVVQVQSDEMEKPVTKEENTNVYGDE